MQPIGGRNLLLKCMEIYTIRRGVKMGNNNKNYTFIKTVAEQLLPYLINHEEKSSGYYMNEN
jgi:hypothetical protein